MAERTSRGRGRPRRDAGGGLLSRDLIVERALDLAGTEGFAALTMHRLARELDVTPRALYNHVADRQEVIDLVAALMMRRLPEPELDGDDWRASLAHLYRGAREVYRSFPRATLIALDEHVTPTEIDRKRITLPERQLRFLVDVGLSLEQAVAVQSGFLIDVFGFVLLVDHQYDRLPPEQRRLTQQPVPQPWLDAHPDEEAPLSRQAARLPEITSDDMFEQVIDMRIAVVEQMLSSR